MWNVHFPYLFCAVYELECTTGYEVIGDKYLSILTLAAACKQCWELITSPYVYDIQFRPTGSHENADGFSRFTE